ncbi:uncharacterized protein DEA37_0013730 [Paragonimus westermani]|uniref:CUB domain-containing protein n=1 Tax=Paragonimus westermani TaxID=34504 RepID=A0A5J4NYQ5_9TREM|nr:uncharacterized protein DEA37_0013730 [Paragonimus westermani]
MHLILHGSICIFMFGICFGSYEEYIILPENSEFCSEYPVFRRFSLSRQMSFTTGSYNSSWNHLLYVCKVRVHPNGRLLQYSYPQGHTSYWFHRLRVEIHFISCDDFLTVGFLPEEITQPALHTEMRNLTCHETYPQIFDSKHRIVSLAWHTSSGSIDSASASQLDVQMSAYMRFEGTFGIADKILRCEAGSGFWCGNQTAVCVYGQMRCDQADGCFDGGSDEVGCPPPRNYTVATVRHERSNWTTYLPWTALCLIPLILIFVLGMICTPRKSLDDFDGDGEADDLKVNSPQTPSPSSMTGSSCGSLKSTRSAVVMKSPNSDLVRTQLLARSSSDPDSIAYALVASVPLPERTHHIETMKWNDGRGGDSCNAFSSTYTTHGTNKMVAPGLISRLSKAVRFQLTQHSDHNESINIHLRRPDSVDLYPDCQRSGRARATASRTSRSAHFHEASTVLSGVENKMFVLPAEFELAALRVDKKYGNHDDSNKAGAVHVMFLLRD